MLVDFALSAELRVSERNKVVNQINRSQLVASDPCGKRPFIETGMPDVQVDRTWAGWSSKRVEARDSSQP